jgi:hypothetical protein
MGVKAAWLAARGLPKAEVLHRLGLAETEETAGWEEFALSCVERPGGWTVVLMNLGDLPKRAALEALSEAGEVLICEISETVMAGEAQGFAGGRWLWRVLHDGGSKGADHLQVDGQPPVEFEAIKARLTAMQDDDQDDMIDYLFDAPADLVFALCGFRANGSDMPDAPTMTVLERVGRPAQAGGGGPLKALARLFGARSD